MLKTETNTPEVALDIEVAAEVALEPPHKRLSVDFEHGQHWVTCLDCGAQWGAHDSETYSGTQGFDFEQVSNGDQSCDESEE